MFVVGDRVRLHADLSLCDFGEVVLQGQTGMVVGTQGQEGVVVSWDGSEPRYSATPERSLTGINRISAQGSRPTISARSSSLSKIRGVGTVGNDVKRR